MAFLTACLPLRGQNGMPPYVKQLNGAPAELLCSKVRQATKSPDLSSVLTEIGIDRDGNVVLFKVVTPKGLHIDKDQDLNKAFRAVRFDSMANYRSPWPPVLFVEFKFNCAVTPGTLTNSQPR